MPGRSKASKYNFEQNVDFGMRALAVLDEAVSPLTIPQIQSSDMMLKNLSTQKISRVLSDLANMGMIIKNKDNSSGRMNYQVRRG